jgi:hypothetical protein
MDEINRGKKHRGQLRPITPQILNEHSHNNDWSIRACLVGQ